MKDDEKLALKTTLRQYCVQILRERLANAEALINAAQESANNESKSSAGDKYETARAMGHLQKDMYLKQAQTIKHDLLVAETTATELFPGLIKKGTVILLEGLIIFICVGIGKKQINDKTVLFVSEDSPLYKEAFKKRQGDYISIDRKMPLIEEIF